MADDLGAAKLSLIIDMADWDVAIQRGKNSLSNLSSDSAQAFNNATHASKRAATSLADYVAYLGKTADQTRLLRAAKNGVDPAAIAAAAEQMRGFAEASAHAENEQRKLAAASAQMRVGKDIVAELREQIATFGMAKNELTLYRAALAGVQSEVLPLIRTLDRLNREQEIAGFSAQASAAALQQQIAAASGYTASQDAAAQATRRRADAEASFLPLLEREAKLDAQFEGRKNFLEQLTKEERQIGKTTGELLRMQAAEKGLSAQAEPIIASIERKEAALKAEREAARSAGKELNKYGLSQKQFEFAMRGVPAQITDIFVSLQGGQNPLTVMLGQGGQLKDMFGGIKPAAAALGGELLKLVNVYTVSAAAVAALAVAWAAADRRQYDFTVALASTNNHVGVSAGQIDTLVSAISALDGVSTAGASDALKQVAASGRIAAEQFTTVAAVAARMEASAGQSIDKTVQKFEEIARDPLEALKKLTASEHFLTNAQEARIKVLMDEGNQTAAVAEATELYERHLTSVAERSEDALPSMTRWWREIKDAVGGAANELVTYIGLIDQVVNKQIGGKGQFKTTDLLLGQWKAADAALGATNRWVKDYWGLNDANGAMPNQSDLSDPDAAKAAEESRKKLADAAKTWRAQVANTDRDMAWQERISGIASKASAAGVSFGSKEYKDALAAEEKAFNESWDKRGKKSQESYGAQNKYELQAIRDQLALEKSSIQASQQLLQSAYSNKQLSAEEYYARQRELMDQSTSAEEVAIKKQIAFLQSANGNKNESINNQKELGQLETRLQQIREKSALDGKLLADEEARYYRERKYAVEDYARSLTDATEAIQRDFAARTSALGMGAREAQIQGEVNDVYVRQEAALRDLNVQLKRKQIDESEFAAKSADLIAGSNAQVQAIRDGYSAMSRAEADWRNGYTSVAADYQQKMGDIAGNTRSVIEGTFDGLNNAIEEAVLTGKANLDDLGKYLTKMAVQFGTTKIFSYLMSMWNPGGGVGGVQREAITPVFNAKGNVYANSPSLSSFSNGVFSSPQVFAFAKGAGVFGEAGPEAIMPLARTSNGDLGVQMAGGGAGGIVLNVNVQGIEGGADVSMNESSPGVFDIDVISAQLERKQAAGIMNGTSPVARALTKRYELKER